jgi:hypothetical protein
MGRICLFLCFSMIHSATLGQEVRMQPVTYAMVELPQLQGSVVRRNPNLPDNLQGTPFYQEGWTKGKIYTQDNLVYPDLFLKVNFLEERIYYLDSIGRDVAITMLLKKIELLEAKTAKPVMFVNGNTLPVPRRGWHQLLFQDSLILIKVVKKTISDHTSYNSDTEFFIQTVESYYVQLDGKDERISKATDFIQFFSKDKKAVVQKFINELDDDLSKDGKLVLTAEFCNNLLKSS